MDIRFAQERDIPAIIDLLRQVGRALYGHICRFARSHSCRSVTLNVCTCNESALRFYEKCGLKPQKIAMEAMLEEE